MLKYTFNSLFISVASTFLALLVGVPAAYSVAGYWVTKASGFVMLARIIPGISLLIPWYYIFAQIGWVGSYQALILANTFVGLPLVIAIMIGYFDGMALKLEAAMIDRAVALGASPRVTVPLSTPGIATSAICRSSSRGTTSCSRSSSLAETR